MMDTMWSELCRAEENVRFLRDWRVADGWRGGAELSPRMATPDFPRPGLVNLCCLGFVTSSNNLFVTSRPANGVSTQSGR